MAYIDAMNENDIAQAAAAFGRMGGRVSSHAKATAAKENGKTPKKVVAKGQTWANALLETKLTVEGFETLNGERLVILRAQDDTVRKLTRRDLRARFTLHPA